MGVLAALWLRCLGLQSARGGAIGALQNYYAVPDYEPFTASVDLVQTEVIPENFNSYKYYKAVIEYLRHFRCIYTKGVCYSHLKNVLLMSNKFASYAKQNRFQSRDRLILAYLV